MFFIGFAFLFFSPPSFRARNIRPTRNNTPSPCLSKISSAPKPEPESEPEPVLFTLIYKQFSSEKVLLMRENKRK